MIYSLGDSYKENKLVYYHIKESFSDSKYLIDYQNSFINSS